MIMKLYSCNRDLPGISGHVHPRSLDELPALTKEEMFLLILFMPDLHKYADILRGKLKGHWVGEKDLVSCMLDGTKPENAWSVQILNFPSLQASQKIKQCIRIYRPFVHKQQIIVITNIPLEILIGKTELWTQGNAISTVYDNFERRIVGFAEELANKFIEKTCRNREGWIALKRHISSFETEWERVRQEEILQRHELKTIGWEKVRNKIALARKRVEDEISCLPQEPTQLPPSVFLHSSPGAIVNTGSIKKSVLSTKKSSPSINERNQSFLTWILSLPKKLAEHWIVTGLTTLAILVVGATGMLPESFIRLIQEPLLVSSLNTEANQDFESASTTVSDFYRYWNLHRYEDARALLTEQFAGKLSNYSRQSMAEFSARTRGSMTISDLVLISGESNETVKVFDYETSYILKKDSKKHGELLRAYVVLRNGAWSIDTIQVQEYR